MCSSIAPTITIIDSDPPTNLMFAHEIWEFEFEIRIPPATEQQKRWKSVANEMINILSKSHPWSVIWNNGCGQQMVLPLWNFPVTKKYKTTPFCTLDLFDYNWNWTEIVTLHTIAHDTMGGVIIGGNWNWGSIRQSLNDIVVLWLRLQTPADCISHSYYIYMYTKCLSIWTFKNRMLCMAKWAKPYGILIEAANPHRLHPLLIILYVYKVI